MSEKAIIKRKEYALFESELLQRMFINYVNNYMDIILISSRTKGLHYSDERSFGAGKSTLALWLSYIIYYGVYYGIDKQKVKYTPYDEKIWEITLSNIVSSIDGFLQKISYVHNQMKKAKDYNEALKYRIPCLIWDDVQASIPAMAGAPKWLVDLLGLITVERPAFANLVLTAPSIDTIARALRKHITYEIIVYERGKAEIQKIIVRKNFRKPDSDLFFLRYLYDLRFDKLPDEVYEEYSRIRQENVEAIKRKFERVYGKNYELIKSDIIQILKTFGGEASFPQIAMILGMKRSDLFQILNVMVNEKIIEIDNRDNRAIVILKSE